ncbi:MAG: DivIVA domain-containing protein [Acidimicrobiia bacterium]|nr:DivIVA domain-containing protein [Acidimicrobiia bacterium]
MVTTPTRSTTSSRRWVNGSTRSTRMSGTPRNAPPAPRPGSASWSSSWPATPAPPVPDATTPEVDPSTAAGLTEMEETLKRTLVLAQRTADDTVASAEAEAESILGEARVAAEKMADEADVEAQRRLDAAQEPIRAEVLRLEQRKRELESAISALADRTTAERARVRRAVEALQQVVDGDDLRALRDAEPDRPDAEEAEEVVPVVATAPEVASMPRGDGAAAGDDAGLDVAAESGAEPASSVAGDDAADGGDNADGAAPGSEVEPEPEVEPVREPVRVASDGAPTQAIDLTAGRVDDSGFLAELRQAVADTPAGGNRRSGRGRGDAGLLRRCRSRRAGPASSPLRSPPLNPGPAPGPPRLSPAGRRGGIDGSRPRTYHPPPLARSSWATWRADAPTPTREGAP